MKTSIRFINHASVLISNSSSGLLCDPWYSGHAFNKGWNLLYENETKEINEILDLTNYIWISHEHPDHFSIKFFKEFGNKIKQNKIIIMFQNTKDKRVLSFLKKSGFEVKELEFNNKIIIDSNFIFTCIKDGNYDSGLLIESENEKILNLNDCVVRSKDRAKEIHKITGDIDILLTQFSYAAWKGGKRNLAWRQKAAQEKIEHIQLQIDYLRPKYIIPFASYIYFSNEDNKYLNDSVNTPETTYKELSANNCKVLVMKPGDVLGGENENYCTESSIIFWDNIFKSINNLNYNTFNTIDFEVLQEKFKSYRKRIINNNKLYFMKIARFLSPIKIFYPITIGLDDLSITIKIDYVNNKFQKSNEPSMIHMHSESLAFILDYPFGFDTLTVNGCFEEGCESGFSMTCRTLAIEILNNNGIYLNYKIIFERKLILSLLSQLKKVSTKLGSNKLK